MHRFGYLRRGCWRAGENIAWGTGSVGTVRAIFRAWLHSSGHRENILGTYRRSASASASANLEGNPGAHVWTQEFGSHAVLSSPRWAPRMAACRTPSTIPTARTATVATELTRGPWDAGLPARRPALGAARPELERLPDAEEFQIGRVTFEILGPVPIGTAVLELADPATRPARAAGRGRAERSGRRP